MDVLNILLHHDPSHHKYRNQTEHEMHMEEWALHSISQYAMIRAMHFAVIILVVLSVLMIIIIIAIIMVKKRAKIKKWVRATRERLQRFKDRFLNPAVPLSRADRMRRKYARFVRKYRKIKLGIKIGLKVVQTIKVRNIVRVIKGIKIRNIFWAVKQYVIIRRNLLWGLRIAILILMINVVLTLFMIIIMVIMVVAMDNYERNEHLDGDD